MYHGGVKGGGGGYKKILRFRISTLMRMFLSLHNPFLSFFSPSELPVDVPKNTSNQNQYIRWQSLT